MPDTYKLKFERVLPIFALTFVDILGLTLILPLLHLYAAAYGASPVEIGLVVATFPLAQLVGVPVMGALSDRYGRKPLLLISQISTCIGFILLGAANSLTMILLSRLIDGLFGANLATAQAALSDLTTEKTRAQGLGLIGAAFGAGFILGPIISILTLELSGNLSLPAFVAAGYSFLSILLTLFVFQETLPPEKRLKQRTTSINVTRLIWKPQISLLLLLMFAQQLVFFGFESLLGLFTLSRLGLLGQGNALLFIVVGVTLVTVQARYIGRWSRKYGERRLVWGALTLLAGGLLVLALTPEQPHPFYVQRIVANKLQAQAPSSAEAIMGDLRIELPPDGNNGIGGLVWVVIVLIPLSIGAGLMRPNLNSLLTKQVSGQEFGGVLGLSASAVSLADAIAPLLAAWIFQQYGSSAPFLLGGMVMGGLAVLSDRLVKAPVNTETQSVGDSVL
jgi:DHA1 family tetracycline resistance protein-like MFS transporter